MKKHFLPALLAIAIFFPFSDVFAVPAGYPGDSLPVQHKHDGITDEWRPEQFTTDAETSIRYAIDNDATDLYLAMIIPNTGTQIKMMRQGMNIYFDLKGKKKESRGIGFPVKPEGETAAGGGFRAGGNRETGQEPSENPERSNTGTDGQTRERKGPDMKRMRMMMATHLMTMHLFGFSEGEPVDQGLEKTNSAQISFTWDTAEVWHIEYRIPLSLFGDPASLDQHLMSVGFKLNGMEAPAFPGGGEGGGGFGGRGGSGGRGGFGGRGGGNQVDFQKMMQEENFWTKYTFVLHPASQKAF